MDEDGENVLEVFNLRLHRERFVPEKNCKGKNFPRSLIKGNIKLMKMREYAKCKQNFLVERCKCIRSYMEYDTNCTS